MRVCRSRVPKVNSRYVEDGEVAQNAEQFCTTQGQLAAWVPLGQLYLRVVAAMIKWNAAIKEVAFSPLSNTAITLIQDQ